MVILRAADKLENPNYPLLGPNLKALYLFGLWQCGNKYHKYLFNFVHVFSLMFVLTEFVELFQIRNDLQKALLNLSVTALSLVSISKTVYFVCMQSQWAELIKRLTEEEISAIAKNDSNTIKIMEEYKKYSRTITYLYWFLVLLTTIVTLTSPLVKYISVTEYREDIRNGAEPFPHILSAWVPFDKNKTVGYVVEIVVHICMTIQGAGVIAVYDTNAVAVMAFLKGQAMIIRDKCRRIFGDVNPITKMEVLQRIVECHRHHNYFRDAYERANSLFSPVMFIYVLVCSITICSSVVQLTLEEVTKTQKLWIVEYASAQAFQLFLYCWHSNEIALATDAISQGIIESNWWRSDCVERKLLILLAGKLEKPYILLAGPFTTLSITTFIDVLKGSYSFYTLLTQMQESKSM